MIENFRQYQITKSRARQFELALEQLGRQPDSTVPAAMLEIQRAAISSQLEDLRGELHRFEELLVEPVRFDADYLATLGDQLIRARLSAGLTQADLGARLGLHEQQIQRYEQSRYASVKLERLHTIAASLAESLRAPAMKRTGTARAAQATTAGTRPGPKRRPINSAQTGAKPKLAKPRGK
ncbi:MAG: helix-turn-helix transcriptional regulator [Pleurocapsa sp. SU_196_0]|nr:helix-turn-helix transcriptional regulator [Pleurocapsa sp. SU_196_0]